MFPVRIVQLQLYKLHIRMLGQQFIQQPGTAVERESPVSDQPLCLQLFHEFPDAEIIIQGKIFLFDRMQQIIIDVTGMGPLQTGVKLLSGALRILFAHPGIQFGRQRKTLSGIAVDQRCTSRQLRGTIVIDIGRIKIHHSRFHEGIDHLFGLFHVDRSVCPLRQTHQTKPQLRGMFTKITFHDHPPILFTFAPCQKGASLPIFYTDRSKPQF